MHQLFTDFKKAYLSVRREVLYDILIVFGVSTKPTVFFFFLISSVTLPQYCKIYMSITWGKIIVL